MRRRLLAIKRRAAMVGLEWAETARSLVRPGWAQDGLPVPPPKLRVLAGGSTDAEAFLAGGRRVARLIEETLARHGLSIAGFSAVLEFGVGCARVARCWQGLPVEIHGTDYNPALVQWCARNLPFGSFQTNGLAPPLAYADARFAFVYAYSVLTHLPEDLQLAWMRELARVLAPGGYLLVTTHGERFAEARLDESSLERFRRGALVVRAEEAAGTNVCAAFHPTAYVRETLARGFELLEFAPGAGPNPPEPDQIRQDVYLLRELTAGSR